MTSGRSPSALIRELEETVGRQREALVSRDAGRLQACGDEVLRLLDGLRALDTPLSAGDRAALARVRQMHRVNGELLDKTSAATSRALSVLFDGPPTYAPGGGAALARPSRPISEA